MVRRKEKSFCKFREKVKKHCKDENYSQIYMKSELESKLDQLYTIGELFKDYLTEGSKIRTNLTQLLQITNSSNPKEHYSAMKRLNNLFTSNKKKEIEDYLKNSNLIVKRSQINQITYRYEKLRRVQEIIDKVAFQLYDLTFNEKKLILEGR